MAEGREDTAGRVEPGDVVVSRLQAVAGGGQRSGRHDESVRVTVRCWSMEG